MPGFLSRFSLRKNKNKHTLLNEIINDDNSEYNFRNELLKCDNNTEMFSLEGQYKLCKVVDVYDGDTIKVVFDLNGSLYRWTIRMIGYDSPEMKPLKIKPNRDVSEDFKAQIKTIFHHLTKEELVDKILANYLAQTATAKTKPEVSKKKKKK